MTKHTISISAELDDATAKAIENGLNQYNEKHAGPDPTQPLWVVCRDEQGNILGGLKGFVQWDWFAIAMLWVREDSRGQGIGCRLLADAEAAARQRGCKRVWLATMTFEAPEFYKKFGYAEINRLPGLPPGHAFCGWRKPCRIDGCQAASMPSTAASVAAAA